MTYKSGIRLLVLAIMAFGFLMLGSSPPAHASPANDGGVAGNFESTIMDTQLAPAEALTDRPSDLAFPQSVDAGLVRPATNAEILELQKAWQDNERQYAEIIKPYYEKRGELLAAMREAIPIGHHWQDPQTGIVFETEEPNGKMVTFDHFGVKRTAIEGESGSGKLAKKRAVELGYKVA